MYGAMFIWRKKYSSSPYRNAYIWVRIHSLLYGSRFFMCIPGPPSSPRWPTPLRWHVYSPFLSLSLVYADGSICLDILQNQWSPIYDVAAILTSIQVPPSAAWRRFFMHCEPSHGELLNDLRSPSDGSRCSATRTLTRRPTPRPPGCSARTNGSTTGDCARSSSRAGLRTDGTAHYQPSAPAGGGGGGRAGSALEYNG